jgi:LPS O-antigen subunit length determinant protein (WzzB/FepE family)
VTESTIGLALIQIKILQIMSQTYYYVLGTQKFFDEEPLDEVLKERFRYYQEQEKEVDFWLVPQPAFLEAPELSSVKAQCPQPASAIVSTNPQFITWLKLRLEFVITGEFQAPSETIPQPLASLASAP